VAHATNNSIQSLYNYATYLFKAQGTWYNAPTINMSTTEVVTSMAKAVEAANVGITASEFINGIADSDINYETRVSWKYGCSRGQVTGTPTFLINGVFINADPSWTLAEWKQVIDPILLANGITTLKPTPTKRAPVLKHPKSPSPYTPLFKFQAPAAPSNSSCPSGETFCQYTPDKSECCLNGENCIPNVGCRCMSASCK